MTFRLILLYLLFFLISFSCKHVPAGGELRQEEYVLVPVLAFDDVSAKAKAEWLDSIFTKLSNGYWFNGAVAYLEHGCLIYQGVFGLADFRTKDSLCALSAFQLASVSKMFTAIAALMLAEDELLDLDADIRQYLPGFPYEGISSRMLLTHRSGLSRYMTLAHEKWNNKGIPLTNKDVIALFAEYKPDPYFKPDQGFHYCNTNYAVMAGIVESLSGMRFADFVGQRIFEPAGMEHAYVYHMDDDTVVSFYVNAGVTGHTYRGWKAQRVRNEYLNGVTGDKGMYASIEDLVKFEQALHSNLLLSEASMREMFSKGSPRYWRREDNYGFGWRIRESEDSTAFHFGWWKGFRNYYIRDLKNGKTLIVLTNKDKGPGSSIYWDIIHDTSHVVKFFESSRYAMAGEEKNWHAPIPLMEGSSADQLKTHPVHVQ
jgi:CubicO group peptidase (beta-lactamase class C family)